MLLGRPLLPKSQFPTMQLLQKQHFWRGGEWSSFRRSRTAEEIHALRFSAQKQAGETGGLLQALPGKGRRNRIVIRVVHFAMGVEMDRLKRRVGENMVDPQEEKNPVVGEFKASSCFFKGVVQLFAQLEIDVGIGHLIQVAHQNHRVGTVAEMLIEDRQLLRAGETSAVQFAQSLSVHLLGPVVVVERPGLDGHGFQVGVVNPERIAADLDIRENRPIGHLIVENNAVVDNRVSGKDRHPLRSFLRIAIHHVIDMLVFPLLAQQFDGIAGRGSIVLVKFLKDLDVCRVLGQPGEHIWIEGARLFLAVKKTVGVVGQNPQAFGPFVSGVDLECDQDKLVADEQCRQGKKSEPPPCQCQHGKKKTVDDKDGRDKKGQQPRKAEYFR